MHGLEEAPSQVGSLCILSMNSGEQDRWVVDLLGLFQMALQV
jgi:hypothetical protein